jgi:hypothetical protein
MMDKHEWPAMSAYAERNDVPDDALGDNPIQFLRDMSISSGPPLNPLEQEEYIRYVEAKQVVYCYHHNDTGLVNGLCDKCQYGPRSERTCMGCRWHWCAPSGDGSAGTTDHKCLAVDQADGAWYFGSLPMQGAKFIDELNHTQNPPTPSWCPCVQIPVTEEQVEFAEHLPAIHCDRGHLDLMRQNVLLRSEVSQLKRDSELSEGRRVTVDLTPKAAQEVDRLRLILGLTTADLFRHALELVRVTEDRRFTGTLCTSCGKLTAVGAACTHCGECGAAQKVTIGGTEAGLLKENAALRTRVSMLEFECKRECERLETIIELSHAENVGLRNLIAESNIKPRVTGQGKP